MKIECEENPDDIISEIGDRYFLLCDESMDEIYRHPNHPKIIRIIDCEDEIKIDISSGCGLYETRKSARALLRLLNNKYIKFEQ